ncbi:MAG: hypothetical protein DYG92_12390 [Leptolyngbya sp. PLA1]|nr:hypothetical protein [Leptolyngbya sp. PLA1]
MGVVVDTNVTMVASRHTPAADERCINACVQRLREIQQSGGLLVDDKGLILREYTRKLGFKGQPGAGEAFAKWAHDNQAIPGKVSQVPITQRSDNGWRRYDEFPDLADLERFDKSDQKFVAVALASGESPPIVNAVDSDWWNHRNALNVAGVTVEFLCPQHAGDDRVVRTSQPSTLR